MRTRTGWAAGVILAASTGAAIFGAGALAKGIAPTNAGCDRHAKGSPAWDACVTAASTSDHELFYAGYWLAKAGRFQEALQYLERTRVKDERVLTYIGYAKRKAGDVDSALGYYARALALNPDYVIARSYLGEAHVVRGEFDKAQHELAEIERRCGVACTEYIELQHAIARAQPSRS